MRARLMALILSPKPPPFALGLLVAAVLITVETVLLFALRPGTPEGARSVVYLCGVLIISSLWGPGLGILTSVLSALAFNYFHIRPYWTFELVPRRDLLSVTVFIGAGLLTSFLADLARARAAEATQRQQEADLAAELARLMLRAGDLRSVLAPAARRIAEVFALRSAAIELGAVTEDDGRAALPLWDHQTRLGTLLVPAALPEGTLERLRQRLVPSLESLLRAAVDREAITDSLRASREEATSLMEEQSALRRVATLVAQGSPPTEVFGAVAEELRQICGLRNTALIRYEQDGTGTLVSGRYEPGAIEIPPGTRLLLDGDCLSGIIKRTGSSARVSYVNAAGPTAAMVREMGIRSGIAAPVMVEGRLWGASLVTTRSPAPISQDAMARLVDFTKLLATAIANADSRAQLTASRARIVAAADNTRRQLERDLHDGTQQRLISLALHLRWVEASVVPPGHDTIRRELALAANGLTDACNDLREISRGLHPAILSKGGLGPALKALARRSPIPVELTVHIDQRLPERVEVTTYYIVSEALTNAAKHAQATMVRVDAEARDAVLGLRIHDDGVGGADTGSGTGLIGLQDRTEALGGRLEVVSPIGDGTTLRVRIPIDAMDPGDAA
ncbi:DUF4118 domain-containing protein [Dactylosporangium sp. NPDC051484]|uniref:DUF4118 domain-containing protein n=1 Tax=Dactylosporangium sp. NPDC051484 TaxID=3154942 RepID=UPI00344B99E6